MNYHIVRMNETINKIALLYNLSIDEIQDSNKHIRNWNNLTPGLKLNLPAIPETVKDDINDIEPFIEDYYPKYNGISEDLEFEEKVEKIISLEPKESVVSKSSSTSSNENINKIKYPKMPIYYNGYYPPYPMYNPYYYYYKNIRKRKK